MAEESRFFDSGNDPDTGIPDRRYDSADWAAAYSSILGGDGIVEGQGNALDVVEDTPPSMHVTIRSGKAWVQGREYENSADLDLAIAANATGSTRIDRVVIRLDLTTRTMVAAILQGVAGAGAPALTQNSILWEFPVKRVTVASGAVSIVNANIATDDRTYVTDLTDLKAAVASVVAEVDVLQADTVIDLPAMTTTARDALVSPQNGWAIYNTTLAKPQIRVAGSWKSLHFEAETTIRFAWTYVLAGEIKVPSSATDYLPLVPISVPSGQAVSLVGYQWFAAWGTSFTFKMVHKTGATLGTNTDLATGIVAATASVKGSGTFTPKVCADADAWGVVVTAVSSTPSGGSVAVLADVTV